MNTRVLAVVGAIVVAIVLIVIAVNLGTGARKDSSTAQTSPSPDISTSLSPSATAASACLQPSDPSSHVYHPDRLQVLQPCITVSGLIDFERKEADGDYHIGLKLDPQYASLVNACNTTCLNGAEHGDLVLEPVCELPVTQADAVSACAGYHNPLVLPPVGAHVTVTGAYVLDLDHGWTEIHPLMTITPA
ncbi:MAG TPA: hypothetical protein VGX27_05310 [Candidatus Dormibacteraeota bacterium]|nr:hypothetical protein [Candidatus Dormibacteraeota bacterium]